jgi:putative membrane protein
MALLSRAEQSAVAETIREIETGTAGEVVVAVVKRSHTYAGYRALWLALALACVWLFSYAYVPTQVRILERDWWMVCAVLLGWLLFSLPSVVRLCVPKEVRAYAVKQRAFAMFAERGVHQTRDASGILIMLSELEREVVILADRGIHAHVGDMGWQHHVQEIVQGIKQGITAQALQEVLRKMGYVLAQHFPPRQDDTNELPDSVYVEH